MKIKITGYPKKKKYIYIYIYFPGPYMALTKHYLNPSRLTLVSHAPFVYLAKVPECCSR